jgi:imidazolonepropionase
MTLRVIEGGLTDGRSMGLLILGAGEIATLAGGLRAGSSQDQPELLVADPGEGSDAEDAPIIATWADRIVAVGPRALVERSLEAQDLPLARFARIDAEGGTITPGLIDAHTHLLFGGSREGELRLRQDGAGYLEILAAGGGILSTVRATRAASSEELLAHGRRWLEEMLSHGVTTIEAKSGYGLDLPTELRLLETAYELGREGPIDVLPTWLGGHAVPEEFRRRRDPAEAYTRHLLDEQLPGVAAQGRARFADVFCEQGVFSPDQSRRILLAAEAFGMRPRLHADELAPSEAGIAALAAAAQTERPVVATLLPATTWFLMADHYAPARTLIERGVPVAIGSDFNPGTSPTANLPLVMTIACLQLRLSPAEALAAVTINAAYALGLGDEIGSIEAGKVADLTIWRVPGHTQIPYWPGAGLVRTVIKRGRLVYQRA